MSRKTDRGRAKDRKREGRRIVNHIGYEGREGEKWSMQSREGVRRTGKRRGRR